MTTNQRNSTIEILRLIFMYLIVMIHVYGHGTGLNYDLIYSWGEESSTAIHLALLALGKVGVTGFMFISGYYGIRMNKRKWTQLLLITLFYQLLFGRELGIRGLFHPYDSWWYISAYIVICMIAPFIDKFSEHTTPNKTLACSVIGLLYYNYVGRFLGYENSHDFVFLLGIYLCARYIRLYGYMLRQRFPNLHNLINNNLCFCCILLTLWIMGIPVLAVNLGISNHIIAMIISNNNIQLLLFATLLIKIAEKYSFYSKQINWVASSALAIYLITDSGIVRNWLDPLLLPYMMNGTGHIFILGVCVACILIDKIRGLLFDTSERVLSHLVRIH